MKESVSIMSLHEQPLSLEGYHVVSAFRYPAKLMYAAKLPPILIGMSLYMLAAGGIIGGGVFRGLVGLGDLVFIAVVFLSIDIVRGLIQRGASRLLGYRISFYTLLIAPLEATFAVDFDQFYPRRDALLIAIAPLCLFLLAGIPLLFQLPTMVAGVLAFVLIVNVLGEVWDVYFICWLLGRPRSTMLLTENIHLLIIFEPDAEEMRKV